MYCAYCGKEIADDAVVCIGCGRSAGPAKRIIAPNTPGQRPRFITVFGILNIIFGVFGLFSPLSAFANMRLYEAMGFSDGFRTWLVISSIIGFGIAIWLIVLGVGLLQLKQSARNGSVAYGWIAIALGIIGYIVTFSTLGPMKNDGSVISGLIGGAFGLVYPILILVFMRKPAAIEACTK